MNAMADKFFDSIKGKKSYFYRNRYKQSSAYKTFY